MALAFTLQPAAGLAVSEKACRFAEDAPDIHQVVPGDTLWDLASRFLRDPWCWPEVWEDNRDAVANPHWIYPGQQIHLDRARGRLTRGPDNAQPLSDQTLPIVRLAPMLRSELIAVAPLPVIASSWLALAQGTPLMSAADLAQATRIAALTADRRMAGAGDVVYARSNEKMPARPGLLSFELRRALAPVIDPDTGQQIALATRRVGRAGWLRGVPGGLQAMQVTEAREEVMGGDLLVNATSVHTTEQAVSPHAAAGVQGRVAAILHDGRWASLHDLVALNRGARDGLDAGSVVNVVRPVRIPSHESPQASSSTAVIDEPVATLLVVDVIEHAALAIVMRTQEPFTRGAAFASPDTGNPSDSP